MNNYFSLTRLGTLLIKYDMCFLPLYLQYDTKDVFFKGKMDIPKKYLKYHVTKIDSFDGYVRIWIIK